jgi:uncharacterized protein with GYD domain
LLLVGSAVARGKERPVPTYVFLSKWTDPAARNPKEVLAWSDQGRAAAQERAVQFNVVGLWWTLGAYDAVSVVELPDDETASAAALRLGMSGYVRTETMRAYTREEMQRIVQRLP